MQIFHPSTNTIAKATILGGLFIVAAVVWLASEFVRSDYVTGVNVHIEQPVQFSHEHHVDGLGIDCRYCHTSVENSSFAGIPPTETCMTCHSQVWVDAPILEPVRQSFDTGEPIEWNRVHDLAAFVYFSHEAHVNKGIGCVTCHGQVDEMPLMRQEAPLTMEWCLSCHREPEKFIRPREFVFDLDWEPTEDQIAMGRRLVEEYKVADPHKLTNCYICHR